MRQGNLEWEEVTGSLTSATIAADFELEAKRNYCHAVFNQFPVFDVTRVALLVK